MSRFRRIQINLTPELSAALDRLAQSRRTARAELLHQALREFLQRESLAEEDPIMRIAALGDPSLEQPARTRRSEEGRTWTREDIYEERLGRFRP